MEGGTWWATVHGVAKSQTWLSDFTFFLFFLSSNEYSGLISFRIDWLDLLAVQRTLKSLLQHHYSKASILRQSAFFMAPHMTPGKTIVYFIAFRLYFLQFLYYEVKLHSRVRLFVTPWTAACQASLSFTISQSLLKLMSIELVMPSDHLILCHPFLLLPSPFPNIRVFSNESALCMRCPKC